MNSQGQDTFSIVAVDSLTGQIGSAGASCVGYIIPTYPHGAQIISDLIPGTGAIHTQAQWNATNQQNAHTRMLAGDSPAQILSWVTLHDAQNDSTVRQYGVVDYNNGHPRSAGFTGTNCLNYKNHITGPNYSIQGNILLGAQILDSIEARFINTNGTLADKLMAALQGAKVVGADTRCASHNTSSLSSFIRVAGLTDTVGNFYLDLYMSYSNTASGTLPVDPIDSLQTLYTAWQNSTGIITPSAPAQEIRVFTDESGQTIFDLNLFQKIDGIELQIFDMNGKEILHQPVHQKRIVVDNEYLNVSKGVYLYSFTREKQLLSKGKLVIR